ncbi:DEAD-domain-containing protein [Myriangium duriaei CBS 260.36]|uniref:RNA helicase n=1 Tax=Myriangium duriaei CBS 260.36 TaxID=1168546 RepID=A0A9P4MCW5_9PEZI|nr:DEAD-domain-containing protein [Myriangium duriaei CBS 260.36]
MAPSSTKRRAEDDFIPTIYDDDDFAVAEEEEEFGASEDEQVDHPSAQINGKKRKRDNTQKSRKKQKSKSEDQPEPKDTADGELDSDFDFQLEDGIADLNDDDEWADGANDDVAVRGIDEIVSARKKKSQAEVTKAPEAEAEDVDLSDEELLADDAFGMGAGEEDEEEDEEEAAGDSEDDEEGSEQGEELSEDEDDELAAPRAHPDDVMPAESSDEDPQDEAEDERRKAFFAPESDLSTPNAIQTGQGSFMDFQLSRPILKGLSAAGFASPTPIQARTIPMALLGKDVVGSAVTGSGKTGAFMIPILERLFYRSKEQPTTRVVVLTPTRELALQAHTVATKLASFTDITFGQAIGGLNQRVQETSLKLRPDIVIATPGRFIDFMRNSSALQTDSIEILVLDEADRMLEDGFADELNEILTSLPKSRQTMLFSATMTSSVDDLIRVGCSRPVRLAVDTAKQTVKGLTQEFIRLRPGREHLRLPYLLHLCTTSFRSRTIIFFRQKALAHRVRVLFALCDLSAAELHGAMSQDQRIQSVEAFRSGKAAFLLATDLASRGLDIKNVDAVINFDAPQSHEIYLHRVGRTARAGRTGRSCTLAAEPDRKVVKAAVKAAREQGAIIKSRTVPAADADKWEKRVNGLEDEIEAVLKEEKEEKVLKQTEMQARKAENFMTHEKEIIGRPKKTWFQGEKDKAAAKEKGKIALNGPATLEDRIVENMKKEKKKLSNKQKKRLALKDEREEGRMWKKGSAQRGKSGDLSQKKDGKGKGKGKGKPNGKGKAK